MSPKALIVVAVVWLAGLVGTAQTPSGGPSPATQNAAASTPGDPEPKQLLTRYCVSCHSDRLKTAELSLQAVDPDNIPRDAATWEKVVRKLRAGAMPPVGRPRPDAATLRPPGVADRGRTRSRGRREAEPRANGAVSPAESDRVPERHPRHPRAGRRCRRAAAGRRRGVRLRQHRRDADRVAGPARSVLVGRQQDQAARGRRPVTAARLGHLSRSPSTCCRPTG